MNVLPLRVICIIFEEDLPTQTNAKLYFKSKFITLPIQSFHHHCLILYAIVSTYLFRKYFCHHFYFPCGKNQRYKIRILDIDLY